MLPFCFLKKTYTGILDSLGGQNNDRCSIRLPFLLLAKHTINVMTVTVAAAKKIPKNNVFLRTNVDDGVWSGTKKKIRFQKRGSLVLKQIR
jgi:hypothetical protein